MEHDERETSNRTSRSAAAARQQQTGPEDVRTDRNEKARASFIIYYVRGRRRNVQAERTKPGPRGEPTLKQNVRRQCRSRTKAARCVRTGHGGWKQRKTTNEANSGACESN
ncbi:hypothetical protein R1flu_004744 [Riccia fluitans]|uniref:Uncharacterized protein n=1 Tax=Riccia fluitans TaxID=41844 RepID=A0ABD1YS08_9MARC